MISKHKSTSLNAELSSLGVLSHRCRQTCSIRRFTATVNRSGQELANVLQKLALGCCWVTHDTDVNITSKLDSIGSHFLDTAKELQQYSFLDIKMAIDAWCHRARQLRVQIGLIFHQQNGLLLLLGKFVHVFFVLFIFGCSALFLGGKAFVRGHYRISHKDHLEAQVFDSSTTKSSEAIHGATKLVIPLQSVVINGARLLLLSWFHELDDIRDNHKGA